MPADTASDVEWALYFAATRQTLSTAEAWAKAAQQFAEEEAETV